MKIKPVTHKDRKEYMKKMSEFGKSESETAVEELIAYREEFVKAHLDEDIDFDSMESDKVDELFAQVEGKMDFRMGLKSPK